MTRKLGIGIGEWKFRIGIGDCGLGLRIRIGDCGHWHGCACTHCIFEPCIYCNLYTFQLSLQDRFCTYDDVTVNIMHFECLCMSPGFRKIFQNCTYWMYGDVMYHHFVFENSWHCQHFMTVDIKCSIISSSSSSVVWFCQIALQFAREKKQRARGKERKKKKKRWKIRCEFFLNSQPVMAFRSGWSRTPGILGGYREASLSLPGRLWHAVACSWGSYTPWPRGRADCIRFASPAEATITRQRQRQDKGKTKTSRRQDKDEDKTRRRQDNNETKTERRQERRQR